MKWKFNHLDTQTYDPLLKMAPQITTVVARSAV